MKITNHFRGIYRICPNLTKENGKMWTCNWLDLQTLGSQRVMPRNLLDHCRTPILAAKSWGHMATSQLPRAWSLLPGLYLFCTRVNTNRKQHVWCVTNTKWQTNIFGYYTFKMLQWLSQTSIYQCQDSPPGQPDTNPSCKVATWRLLSCLGPGPFNCGA